MPALTALFVGSLSTSNTIPEGLPNDPSRSRVTFAPTNATFESAFENACVTVPTAIAAADVGAADSDTVALA